MTIDITRITCLDCELQILLKRMFVLSVAILYNEQGEKGAVVGERTKKDLAICIRYLQKV